MPKLLLFAKAAIGQNFTLFDTQVPVKGHMSAGHYVKPHTARRRKAAQQETAPRPVAAPEPLTGDALIDAAIEELRSRMQTHGDVMQTPRDTRNFLELNIAAKPHEAFCALYLDARHRLIEYEELFRGTIDGAAVYPREVVKSALKHDAAAVIFAHNHPSGVAEPSRADRDLTRRLRDALAVVDIRTLDHMVVGHHGEIVSFAERGML